jgi:hypothetical protein
MEPEPTCGTGVADQAVLPARLADLTDSLAAVLEIHQQALDRADPNARLELEAYQEVAQALRASAAQLKETAGRMAASRTVPMGRHDGEALSSPRAIQAFASFVTAKQELLTLLRDQIEEDERMLAGMRRPEAASR